MNISTRIYLGFSFVLLVPLLLLGMFSYGVTYQSIIQLAEASLMRASEVEKYRVERVVTQNRERLALVASRTQLRLSLEKHLNGREPEIDHVAKMERILGDARKALPSFERISIHGKSGEMVASTDPGDIGKTWIDSSEIQQALQGRESVLFHRNKDHLIVELCSPLTLEDHIIGAIRIEAGADEILSALLDSKFISRSGSMILAQRDESPESYHLLTAPKHDFENPRGVALIEAALNRPSEFHNSKQFGNGDPFLVLTQPIANGNLGLVIMQNRAEALSDANRVLKGTLFMAVGALSIIGPIAFFLARSISRPVNALAQTAHEVSKGGLDSRVDISSPGEMGKLIDNFNFMVTSLQDSTKNLQRTVDTRTAALKRSNDELQHFASVAAHDLNAPLRTIGSFTQLLETRLDNQLDDKSRDWMDRINTGVANMQALINELLTYSRIESRAAPLQPVDCGQIFEQAVSALDLQLKETGARVTCEGDLPTLAGDASQLCQLFQNLIGNAVNYQKPETKPEVNISARELPDEKGWEFQVKDNGIGIAPENIDKVFRIFERLHSSSEYSGTGIGLAVCKKVVERHGGKIWVESEIDKGSVFRFILNSPELNGE